MAFHLRSLTRESASSSCATVQTNHDVVQKKNQHTMLPAAPFEVLNLREMQTEKKTKTTYIFKNQGAD
jgi:hypothetical protein